MRFGFIGAVLALGALGLTAGPASQALAQTTPASSFTGTWTGEVDQPGHEASGMKGKLTVT